MLSKQKCSRAIYTPRGTRPRRIGDARATGQTSRSLAARTTAGLLHSKLAPGSSDDIVEKVLRSFPPLDSGPDLAQELR